MMLYQVIRRTNLYVNWEAWDEATLGMLRQGTLVLVIEEVSANAGNFCDMLYVVSPLGMGYVVHHAVQPVINDGTV